MFSLECIVVVRSIRWVLFLPLAFAASIFAGFIASSAGELFGGSSWYVWLLSGAGSAWAFFATAFRIAPERNRAVKWMSVIVVGTAGTLSAIGVIASGADIVRSTAGIVMAGFAVYYALRPVALIQSEVLGSSVEHATR